MAASDNVQIDINELMSSFARENSALLQRALIAEQRARALARLLDAEKAQAATPTEDVEVVAPAD